MHSRVRASALLIVAAAAVAATLAGAGGATIASGPTNNTPPTASSSNLVQGTVASTNGGSWSGSSITYAYKWETCADNTTLSCSDISSATGTTYQFQASDVGNYVRSLVTATNGGGSTDAYSNALGPIVAATTPTGVAPTISGTAKVGQTLTVNDNTGSWTGTSPITYAHQWQRCDSSGNNCSNIASNSTGTTYTVTSSDLGDTLREETTGTNVAGSDPEESAATAVVTAGAPVNTALPVVTGTDQTGSRLTTSNGSWLGTTPITYTYTWKRCDANGNSCSTISGATASNYTLTSSDSGHDIRSVVTATNSAGSASATSAASATVASGSPVNTVLPTVNGTGQVGQNLQANNGTWTGLTPITYTYQWQRCDASGNNCNSISGATKNSYATVTADANTTIRVQVTATNSAGNTTATSKVTSPIVSTAPVNTVAPTLSGTLKVGQSLSLAIGTWTGQNPITYTYQWQRCTATAAVCTSIPGANRTEYTLQSADASAYIRAAVTAANRGGNTTVNSNLVGPVQGAQAPLPAGAHRLASGAISVPLTRLSTGDILHIASVKVSPATIKHRKLVRITLKVTDRHAYVISGAKVTVTATKATWIARVTARPSNVNGQITLTIRPTLKAPLKGTLTLRIRPSTPRGGKSTTRIVKIKMRA